MPKPGYFTPSKFKEAMTNGRGKDTPGQTAIDYAHEIAMQRLGVVAPEVTAPALDWGNEYEDLAINTYQLDQLCEVERVIDPLVHPDYYFVAGTPDGMIGTDGLVEVKCPYNPKNHLLNIVDGAQIKQYNPQMQGYMWITGANWCDFVSFDPRYPDQLKIKIIRIERDQEYIDRLAERIVYLDGIASEIVEKLLPDLGGMSDEMIQKLKEL